MEPTKTQSSALFTSCKNDFRDKVEEVSEKFQFFDTQKFPSHILFSQVREKIQNFFINF